MALALALARAISYAPRVMVQIVVSLTDDSKGIIYVCGPGHCIHFNPAQKF
jgi:hypothetical protein